MIATCNYEARAFGVRSAMSSAQALRRCPDLLILRPAMDKYREVSRRIFAIYREYTALVEPLSLDEAYLDVSECPHHDGSATRIAEEIRRRVREEVGVTVSAGVGPNKFVAKIASDWNKPDGLFVVRPGAVDAFVAELPVGRIHGVGAVTAAKLKRLAPRPAATCGNGRLPGCIASSAASVRGSTTCAAVSTTARYRPSANANRSAWRKPMSTTCRTCKLAWLNWNR